MDLAVETLRQPPDALLARPDLCAPALELPTFTLAQLRGLVHSGENEADLFERALANSARAAGALDLAIGDGLAAVLEGDRLMRLGFSRLGNYVENILGIGERKAQTQVQLSRALRSRPLLRAAVRAGEVTIRNALTVLPVAKGEAEAGWVARARTETVRSLEKAVKAARKAASTLPGPDAAAEAEEAAREPLVGFGVRLQVAEREVVDESLELAGEVLGQGSSRGQRLEAMAQEWLGSHPVDVPERLSPAFRELAPRGEARDEREERLERECEGWTWLDPVEPVPAPEAVLDELAGAEEIDAMLCGLANERRSWDDLLGFCADAVKRTGLHRLEGFVDFDHYAKERLGLAPRTVEQRAALERRLREAPALREAKEAGLNYEKLRLLSTLRDPKDVAALAGEATTLTVVELREKVTETREGQMRASDRFRAAVPRGVALLLSAAFESVRRVEGMQLSSASCLVRVARHFIEVWKDQLKPPRTVAQKVRARDVRCLVPGCSRPAGHSHHVVFRSHGGGNGPEQQLGGCIPHHLVGIHGGYIEVSGRAPDQLTWKVGGRVWKDARFGRGPDGRLLPLDRVDADEC